MTISMKHFVDKKKGYRMYDLYLQENPKPDCFVYFHIVRLIRTRVFTEMNFEIVTGLGVVSKQKFIKAVIHV